MLCAQRKDTERQGPREAEEGGHDSWGTRRVSGPGKWTGRAGERPWLVAVINAPGQPGCHELTSPALRGGQNRRGRLCAVHCAAGGDTCPRQRGH